jgi:hypothetical protein
MCHPQGGDWQKLDAMTSFLLLHSQCYALNGDDEYLSHDKGQVKTYSPKVKLAKFHGKFRGEVTILLFFIWQETILLLIIIIVLRE